MCVYVYVYVYIHVYNDKPYYLIPLHPVNEYSRTLDLFRELVVRRGLYLNAEPAMGKVLR